MTFPVSIIAGDTLKVEITSKTYTAADGFAPVVYLYGPNGDSEAVLTGSPTYVTGIDDTTFELKVPASVTAAWDSGQYNYSIVATDGDDEYTIESGTTNVVSRADNMTGDDNRSHAQKTLDAIKAVLEGRASSSHTSYSIAGRSITLMTFEELIEAKKYYENEVRKEAAKAKGKNITKMIHTMRVV